MDSSPTNVANADPFSAEFVTANIQLSLSDRRMSLEIQVPTASVRPGDLLPLFRRFTDAVMEVAEEDASSRGLAITCRKGCGACCRQLVPISEIEARWIRDAIRSMPEMRTKEVLARFAEARRRLEEAGLLVKLLEPSRLKAEEIAPFGGAYFDLGIPCPFLEDEACSIHPDRPLACREYLVSSPAGNCAHPRAETIERIETPCKPSLAVARLEEETPSEFMPWVPLILAPEWAEAHPDSPPIRTGTEIVEEFFSRMSDRNVNRTRTDEP